MFVSFGFAKSGLKPFAIVLTRHSTEAGANFPVVTGDKAADLFLTAHDNGERRRLDPTDGGQEKSTIAGIERGHGACAVNANQPVRLGTTLGGGAQFGFVVLQTREALPNRGRGHRLQPQPSDRLLGFGKPGDLLKNQLPFTARVTRIDQNVNVLALD